MRLPFERWLKRNFMKIYSCQTNWTAFWEKIQMLQVILTAWIFFSRSRKEAEWRCCSTNIIFVYICFSQNFLFTRPTFCSRSTDESKSSESKLGREKKMFKTSDEYLLWKGRFDWCCLTTFSKEMFEKKENIHIGERVKLKAANSINRRRKNVIEKMKK